MKSEVRSSKDEGRNPKPPVESPAGGVVQLPVLVACASVLQVAESLLPHPLPGVRLGLANVITLIALVYTGPGSAVSLAMLRTVVSSMVMGTFLTPTFVLSLSGGVVSAFVMILLYTVSRRGGPLRFSIIGISVAGSVSHVGTQVALVYLLFVRSSGVLWLWPWLALAAVAAGVVTGLVAVQAFHRLEDHRSAGLELVAVAHADPASGFGQCSSSIRRLDPAWKILAAAVLSLIVVLFAGYRLYAAAFVLLVLVAVLARVSFPGLARSLARVWALFVVSFLMPIIFTPWGRVLFTLGPVRVTSQGLNDGVLFTARLLLLFFATALLAATTSPHDLAVGLGRLLSPLRVFGFKPGRLAETLSISWAYFPEFWERAKAMVGQGQARKGWFDRVIHLPGDVVAELYLLAGQAAAETRGGTA